MPFFFPHSATRNGRKPVCVLTLFLGISGAYAFEGAGQAAVILQRRSVERQKAATAAAAEAVAEQQVSVVQQRQAVLRARGTAPAWTWPPPPAAVPCEAIPAASLDGVIGEAAARQRLSPRLIRAVIAEESAFRPCAVSPKGAMGLMQLMPATAGWLGLANPFDPRENIASGARLLRMLLDRYGGRMEEALAAYNAGAARVDSAGGIPPIPETQRYVPRVLRRLLP